MSLPPDFGLTLSKVAKAGILDENLNHIERRLNLVAEGIAAAEVPQDLGITDWTTDSIHKIKVALHKELCDLKQKELKSDYKQLLDQGLTTDGVTAISTVVGGVVAAFNPAFFVSSVVIYLSIWLLKRGLNQWCAVEYH